MVTQGRTGDDGGAAQLPQWRMGMRVRGGRITHTIARVGWVVFGAVGIVLAGAFAVLFGVTDDDPEIGFAPTVIGGMIVFLPLCVVPATLVGLGAQYGARAWLRTAPRVVSQRDRDEQELAAQLDEAGLHGGTRWARHYTRCLRAVGGFHDIIDELPEGAASDWFGDIGERLDEQLAEALRLAKLGQSLTQSTAPRRQLSPTAARVDQSLQQAGKAFDRTTERAANISLDLHGAADFTRVRAQLDMLQQQAPQLHQP